MFYNIAGRRVNRHNARGSETFVQSRDRKGVVGFDGFLDRSLLILRYGSEFDRLLLAFGDFDALPKCSMSVVAAGSRKSICLSPGNANAW